MNVIMLAAGIGARLKPFTESIPKALFRLGKDVTILGRMVSMVKRNSDAEIYVVTGFMREKIESSLQGVTFVHNPFYRVTNSIASLWFAKKLLGDETIIINADVVVEEPLFKEVLRINKPAAVLIDSSKIYAADYKVATFDERVVMMGKNLSTFSGEYAGITKLSKNSALKLKRKVEIMIDNEQIDEWYESALVRMILEDNFVLNFRDIPNFQWVEVDTPDDLLSARKIHEMEKQEGL